MTRGVACAEFDDDPDAEPGPEEGPVPDPWSTGGATVVVVVVVVVVSTVVVVGPNVTIPHNSIHNQNRTRSVCINRTILFVQV